MADAHGSGPCGRKSLRVQLPFRPFFSDNSMKRIDYYRPSYSSLGRKKRVRKSAPLSFVKPILLFIIFMAVCGGTYILANKVYTAWKLSEAGKWMAEEADISGADEELTAELFSLSQPKLNKPFSVQDAVAFQAELTGRYPQLRRISVKRGLLNNKLKVTVQERVPIAKFQKNGMEKLLDEDGCVYSDSRQHALQEMPLVELTGEVPQHLDKEYVDLIQSALKLKKQLKFIRVKFNLTDDTVKMYLAGEREIDFGVAKQLRQKARRAAQIEGKLPADISGPYVLDFTYFDDGKVFLRQKAH